MKYRERRYTLFSACGLNCGLCPRYYTQGTSKCPGCAGEGFSNKHPSCGVLSCCQRHEFKYCYQCGEFPCKKYDGADLTDSFITHKNQFIDLAKAKDLGIATYQSELNRKVVILQELLSNYDDGRRKSFYCVAVNLLDLQDVENIIVQIREQAAGNPFQKEKALIAVRLFQETANKYDIDLKLRQRSKS